MSKESLSKPPKIVLEDDYLVEESAETSFEEPSVTKISVSLEEPSSVLLWLSLLGYGITMMGTFMVWDSDIVLCLNILFCGSFASTIALMIYHVQFGNWEKNTGQSTSNSTMTTALLGVVSVVVLGVYLFLYGFF